MVDLWSKYVLQIVADERARSLRQGWHAKRAEVSSNLLNKLCRNVTVYQI